MRIYGPLRRGCETTSLPPPPLLLGRLPLLFKGFEELQWFGHTREVRSSILIFAVSGGRCVCGVCMSGVGGGGVPREPRDSALSVYWAVSRGTSRHTQVLSGAPLFEWTNQPVVVLRKDG